MRPLLPLRPAVVVTALLVGAAGLLCSLLVGNPFVVHRRSERDTTRMQMQIVDSAISLYRLDRDATPRSLDDLTQPDSRAGQPYLAGRPRDAWGHDFEYRVIDAASGRFELVSGGPDRQFGTEDDLHSPEANDATPGSK